MTAKKAQRKSSVQKRFTTGFEVEFFIIDKKTGAIAHGADDILKKAAETSQGKTHNILKESAKNLIEVGSYPDVDGANTMTNLIEGLKLLTYVADELGLAVLPLGTYPGKVTPSMRTDKVRQKLFGRSRSQISGRVAGYHCHNSLPWGVFDSKALMLKRLENSKNMETVVHAYNMAIALDPALTTFMQSSPFYQGRHIAKDSRTVVYRGGEQFGLHIKGLYTNLSRFGALPPYEHSGADIINSIESRYNERMRAMRGAGIPEKDIPKYKSKLVTNWTPVKINPHGTLEQRGMDMNHLPLVLSASVLVWRVLHHVQERHLTVVRHDVGKKEPFKLEKGTILVPPDAHVREHLQKLSALKGLEHDEMFEYCKRLVALVKQLDGKRVEWLLKPLDAMLEERQTTSDKILAQAKALGYKDLKKILPQGIAQEIAKTHSKQMFEDIVLLEKMIGENEKLTE
jgi:hypothetical protein